MKIYFILVDGEQQGPFSLEELKGKELNRDTMVWFRELDKWTKCSHVPQLKSLFEFTPPPINLPPPIPPLQIQPIELPQESIPSVNKNIKQSKDRWIVASSIAVILLISTLIIYKLILNTDTSKLQLPNKSSISPNLKRVPTDDPYLNLKIGNSWTYSFGMTATDYANGLNPEFTINLDSIVKSYSKELADSIYICRLSGDLLILKLLDDALFSNKNNHEYLDVTNGNIKKALIKYKLSYCYIFHKGDLYLANFNRNELNIIGKLYSKTKLIEIAGNRVDENPPISKYKFIGKECSKSSLLSSNDENRIFKEMNLDEWNLFYGLKSGQDGSLPLYPPSKKLIQYRLEVTPNCYDDDICLPLIMNSYYYQNVGLSGYWQSEPFDGGIFCIYLLDFKEGN